MKKDKGKYDIHKPTSGYLAGNEYPDTWGFWPDLFIKIKNKVDFFIWFVAAAFLIIASILFVKYAPPSKEYRNRENPSQEVTSETFRPQPAINQNKLAAISSTNWKHYLAHWETQGDSLRNAEQLISQEIEEQKSTVKNALKKARPEQSGFSPETSGDNTSLRVMKVTQNMTLAKQQKKNENKRIYFGVSGEISNSWLLNNKTLYSVRSSIYSSVQPEMGISYGFLGGIHLTNKLDVQLETQITNTNGQIYKEYMQGDFVTNQISLKYSSVGILAKYRLLESSFSLPVSHHILAGTYGGYLRKARQRYDEQQQDISFSYRNVDWGLIVGYEFDTHITTDYVFSAGIRYNPGLINIYKGTNEFPGKFNKTYNSAININLSLNYNF